MSFTDEEMKIYEEILKESKQAVIAQRMEEWEKLCKANVDSKIGVSLLKDVVLAMNLLKEGKEPIEVRDEVDKGQHSGLSWALVVQTVVKFSPRGFEFYDKITPHKQGDFYLEMEKLNNENQKFINKNENSKK